MKIQCACGQVEGIVQNFPKNTPGRLVCYCDDCQNYLKHLHRDDLLNFAGGTELVPVYPQDLKITKGQDHLQCLRLTSKGMFRWYTSCCNTPICNTQPGFPWIGFNSCVYKGINLEKEVGPVRSSVYGMYASQTPPKGTSHKLKPKDMMAVLPFVIKGFILGKSKPSPFFKEDGKTPIKEPLVLKP